MPMPRWEDEDEYLTWMAKVLDRVNRDDPQPTAEERLAKYLQEHWIDICAESVGEADGHFFSAALMHYEDDDALAMGRLWIDAIRAYSISCATAWNVIDEGELDE